MRILIPAIIALLLGSFYAFVVYKVGVQVDEDNTEMKAHIGEEVVLGSDTLIITTYSIWNNEYYLSNGATISKEFLNK